MIELKKASAEGLLFINPDSQTAQRFLEVLTQKLNNKPQLDIKDLVRAELTELLSSS